MSTEPVEIGPTTMPVDVFGPTPQQQEMPLALVRGEPVLSIPQDLYIPPDALEVILEAFEGPLDLLLYLIRRQNLNILDIPIAEITRQYMKYIEMMHDLKLELAAEYLVMAAILAEIKSRLLLPRPPDAEVSEDDPRAELIRRLQEYERFKLAAENIDALPRVERDTCLGHVAADDQKTVRPPPEVDLHELILAFKNVLRRVDLQVPHAVQRDTLSVRQRMSDVLKAIEDGNFHSFASLFTPAEGRLGVVVTFAAMLELAKDRLIEIIQEGPFNPIYLQSSAANGSV